MMLIDSGERRGLTAILYELRITWGTEGAGNSGTGQPRVVHRDRRGPIRAATLTEDIKIIPKIVAKSGKMLMNCRFLYCNAGPI
jgi:hypothetical protein